MQELNKAIYIDNLSESNHYIFAKVIFSNNEEKYFSLSNTSKYENITYYTTTRNNSNNKIDINFDNYNDTPYLKLQVSPISQLPTEIYDIVIDPGHGGNDSGVKSGKYTEANLALDCGLSLKKQLEKLGYKILMTRDQSQLNTENTLYNMYDDNGRVNIANKSHAKLLISLHMSSNNLSSKSSGFEVYAPSMCNLDFAKSLAENIKTTAKTTYSTQKSYKQDEGVYVKNFTYSDIYAYKSSAIKNKYQPYNITTSTPYIYMIREIGGIATNAFVDGRNKSYGANKYVNSNIGIEGYSIELGYITNSSDLNNISKNSNLYAQGIANSIQELFK